MGFFSDLKEDLSQAMNEMMPEENLRQTSAVQSKLFRNTTTESTPESVLAAIHTADSAAEKILKNNDSTEVPTEAQAPGETTPAPDSVLQEETLEKENTTEEQMPEDPAPAEEASEDTAVITAGMVVNGDLTAESSLNLAGTVNGNVSILGRLNITGSVNGDSKAAEITAEGAKVNGEVVSEGLVRIGASTVVIGNITATSAVVAGAVRGDIDVHGPVILEASAIVKGDIKSKSVQINNGAVIDGMCSQCYADVNPASFFDDYKPEKIK